MLVIIGPFTLKTNLADAQETIHVPHSYSSYFIDSPLSYKTKSYFSSCVIHFLPSVLVTVSSNRRTGCNRVNFSNALSIEMQILPSLLRSEFKLSIRAFHKTFPAGMPFLSLRETSKDFIEVLQKKSLLQISIFKSVAQFWLQKQIINLFSFFVFF